ncbi:MAG: chromate efflux transporter [Tissierellia bacterium]|nr:chromate efflux transporter [Tissierellia bacterium]
MKNKREFYTLSNIEQRKRLIEIAFMFFKLGITAFGGPAAHVAMMDEEIVKKRKWVSSESFLDFYGVTNLLPGPNSTELAIHLGYERGGWLGLIIAGVCFILPAMMIVTAFAAVYVSYGSLPEISGIMNGIKPVIIAVILQALLRLGKSALKNKSSIVLFLFTIALSYFGYSEIFLLFLSGIIMMLIVNRRKLRRSDLSLFIPTTSVSLVAYSSIMINKLSLSSIFSTFFKIGLVLYGSGYVLLAYLESYFVETCGVITTNQLLDAVSVGQFTPGPIFTTATFIGYLLHGVPGAIVATIGIFLPAFLFVGLLNNILPVLRRSSWAAGILDGVNVASLAFMAVVSMKLVAAAIVDLPTAVLAIISIFLVFKYNINSAWLVLGGGLIGFFI